MDINIAASEEEFIDEMRLWILKGVYPLQVITFLNSVNNRKLVALPRYVDPEEILFLDNKDYLTYQTALQRVGGLMDKVRIKEYQLTFKSTHPLSCPYFNEGMEADIGSNNPYSEQTFEYCEWQEGNNYSDR